MRSKATSFAGRGEAAPRTGRARHGPGDVLEFGYLCGWRIGEVARLEWRDVERDAGVARLRPELSKNNDGRVLVLSNPLRSVIERRWQARVLGCPFVFHHEGARLFHAGGSMSKEWKAAWKEARQKAGLSGKLFHNLRRTVARNLVRAGEPEAVAMIITGHKTRSVFDRYNIVTEADLGRATARLAEYVEAQSKEPTVVPLPKAAEGRSR